MFAVKDKKPLGSPCEVEKRGIAMIIIDEKSLDALRQTADKDLCAINKRISEMTDVDREFYAEQTAKMREFYNSIIPSHWKTKGE